MKITQLRLLALLLVVHSACNEAISGELPWHSDGSSLRRAIRIDAQENSACAIDLLNNRLQFVSFGVSVPTRVKVSVQSLEASEFNEEISIQLLRDMPEHVYTMVPIAFSHTEEQWIGTFDLHPGSYVLQVASLSRPSSRGKRKSDAPAGDVVPTHNVEIIEFAPQELRNLDLRSGDPITLPLERLSGTGFLGFTLEHQSRLTIELEFNQVWRATDNSGRVDLSPVDSSGKRYRPERFPDPSNPDHILYQWVLPAGTYALRAQHRKFSWAGSAMPEVLANAPPKLRVVQVTLAPIPHLLRALDEWLAVGGLHEKIEIVEWHDTRKDLAKGENGKLRPQRHMRLCSCIGAIRALREHIASTGDDRLTNKGWALMTALEYGASWQESVDPGEEWQHRADGLAPRYVLRLRTHMSRDELAAVERTFIQESGISLWQRLGHKLALTAGVHSGAVLIEMPVYCSGSLIFELEPGQMRRWGSECLMASAAVRLSEPIAEKLTNPAKSELEGATPDLATHFDRFLKSYYSGKNALVEYHAKVGNYVMCLVRGLRGEVIKGSSLWEKLQIALVLSTDEENEPTLHVFVDGQLTSGIGGYPPDSQFTTSMEPKYSENLNNYAKALSVALKQYFDEPPVPAVSEVEPEE